MNGQTVRTITIRGTSEGLDKLTGDLQKLAAAEQNVAVVSEQMGKKVLSLEQAWQRQTMRLDETARAQNNFAREVKLANDALAQGVASPQQYARQMELIKERFGQISAASREMIAGMTAAGDAGKRMVAGMSGAGAEGAAKGIGLARHEMVNLGRQAQDIAVSLASGQSPFTVLFQQGSQIADVFLASGKSVGSFFSQAIGWGARFLTSTAGIVTGIGAIGAAAIYAAYQFSSGSKTIQQALEEENRLLKEGKALIDARTSAEERAKLQGRSQTEFETMRNALDLQIKLNQAMEESIKIAQRRATTPTQVPGEMGEAPTAFAPQSGPGMAEITAAFERLREAQAAGLPGLKQFNDELGRIGMLYPEIAKTIEEMIKANEGGMALESAAMRAKAMSDALKGIATDAQMAAVGLNSVAQFQLDSRRAQETKDATERMAQATLTMAQAYPGMSVDVAKMLSSLQDQLAVASAVGEAERMAAQERARSNQLILEGKSVEEASAVAAAERANAQARINAEHERSIINLQAQLNVAQQVTGAKQIQAQYEANIIQLMQEGLSLAQATEQAELQRATALAQVEAAAARQLQTLQNEYELIKATSEEERGRIQARQTYNKLIEEGVSQEMAGAVAAQQAANSRARDDEREKERSDEREKERSQAERDRAWLAEKLAREREAAAEAARLAANEAARVAENTRRAAEAANEYARAVERWNAQWEAAYRKMGMAVAFYNRQAQLWERPGSGTYTQFDPAGYESTTSGASTLMAMYTQSYGQGGFDPKTGAPNQQGLEYAFNQVLTAAGGNLMSVIQSQLGQGLVQGTEIDTGRLGILSRAIDLLPEQQQIGPIQQLIGQLEAGPKSIQSLEMIKQLNDKLEQLTRATDANTSATSAMTDVLSPFYSSDPRRTHLGFRAFAGGGIMSSVGELPMMAASTQRGGVTTTPQIAMFGEGSVPEAYVPVPSGRIPVEISAPANSNVRPVNVTINVMGNATSETVAALKQTGFQKAQQLRRGLG